MDVILLEEFIAGHREKISGYKYFVPKPVNKTWKWSDQEISFLLEAASSSLGELNSYAKRVPNLDLFITLHVTKEAQISSKIEGTKTQIDEVFMSEEDVNPERRDDWKEVTNYINAMNYAMKRMKEIPISSRLICESHAILLEGARGEYKLPGEFRSSQNWIGGDSIMNAKFIPPIHNLINELMGDLENFIHNESLRFSKLVKIAIAHYQFETIHPFLDGNGRIGRLIIPLFLVENNLLLKPLLYMSEFFEKNRILYYDKLTEVREKNDMTGWIKYFLVGVDEVSRKSTATLDKIIELEHQLKNFIVDKFGRRSSSALKLLNYLFMKPLVRVKDVEEVCELSAKAANNLIALFEEHKILKEQKKQQRNRLFLFHEYLQLFS